MVNFFASWCVPCLAEHPLITRLSEDGLTVYGVNHRDTTADATQWLKRNGNPYTFVGADPEGIGFVTNATTGVNSVMRSFPWAADDEVVITDHGYNACNNAVRFAAERAGAHVRVAKLPWHDHRQGLDERGATEKVRRLVLLVFAAKDRRAVQAGLVARILHQGALEVWDKPMKDKEYEDRTIIQARDVVCRRRCASPALARLCASGLGLRAHHSDGSYVGL